MNIKVKEDYYSNACSYYASQIEAIESYLDDFREQYQALFESVEFGEHLGMVLIGKCDGFYGTAKGKLSELFESVKTLTNSFVDDIEKDDNLS